MDSAIHHKDQGVMLRDALSALEPYFAGQSELGYTKLSANENPFGMPRSARRAIGRELKDAYRYPPPDPQLLRQKIAARHQRTAQWVTIGNGSDELLNIIAAAIIERGYEGIVAAHTFSVYRQVVRLYGGRVITFPMVEGALDWRAVLAAVGRRTHIIFLANPNNPTGSYMGRTELIALMKALPSQVLVVIDEAYADFANAPDFAPGEELLKMHENMVILRTFSKIYALAGLRIGYALAVPRLTEAFNRIRSPFNCNRLAQAAALAVLDDRGSYQRARTIILAERKRMLEALCRAGFSPWSSQGNFICLPVEGPAEEYVQRLKAQGILVRALTSFGLPHHVRITIGRPRENWCLLRALRAIRS